MIHRLVCRLVFAAALAAPLFLSACAATEDDPSLDVAASDEGLCYREAYVRCWRLYPRGYDDPNGLSCFEGADLAYWEGPDSYSLCQYADNRGVCQKSWTFVTVCARG
jgi:hypothetical protein